MCSVHDKQLRADGCRRAVGFSVVGDLVAHARLQDKVPSVLQFCVEFAFQTKQDVPLGTPMIGKIAGGILNHANPD